MEDGGWRMEDGGLEITTTFWTKRLAEKFVFIGVDSWLNYPGGNF
jgi:hypothetical protein